MSAPEPEILHRLLERLDRLQRAAVIDRDGLGDLPANVAAFDSMEPHRQSAARAALKSFEQIEDQLSRAFRVIPGLIGVDSAGWFARDHADFMERVGVLDDAAEWGRIVRLRNELVHDYPLDAEIQLRRLLDAIGYFPFLAETYRRLTVFVRDDLPGKLL